MKLPNNKSRRRGAAIVEMAFVIVIFTMILFGILEYCLLIYSYQIVENAAREGARYAVVNVTDATMVNDTKNVVKTSMYNLDTKMANYSCDVYMADSAGAKITTKSATEAKFGEFVCVEVSVNYVPITPGLLYLSTIKVRSRSSMGSEAN